MKRSFATIQKELATARARYTNIEKVRQQVGTHIDTLAQEARALAWTRVREMLGPELVRECMPAGLAVATGTTITMTTAAAPKPITDAVVVEDDSDSDSVALDFAPKCSWRSKSQGGKQCTHPATHGPHLSKTNYNKGIRAFFCDKHVCDVCDTRKANNGATQCQSCTRNA